MSTSIIVIRVSRCMADRAFGISTARIRSIPAAFEQRAGKQLDAHRRGSLAHADHDGAVAEDVDVAALPGRGGVVASRSS